MLKAGYQQTEFPWHRPIYRNAYNLMRKCHIPVSNWPLVITVDLYVKWIYHMATMLYFYNRSRPKCSSRKNTLAATHRYVACRDIWGKETSFNPFPRKGVKERRSTSTRFVANHEQTYHRLHTSSDLIINPYSWRQSYTGIKITLSTTGDAYCHGRVLYLTTYRRAGTNSGLFTVPNIFIIGLTVGFIAKNHTRTGWTESLT